MVKVKGEWWKNYEKIIHRKINILSLLRGFFIFVIKVKVAIYGICEK